MSEVGQITE